MIRAWRYVSGTEGHETIDLAHVSDFLDPEHAVVWIDCTQPSDVERELIRRSLHVSPTVMEALTSPKPQRTKLQRYGNYFHVAVHDCDYRGEDFESREIDVMMGPGWLVTVRHPAEHSRPFDIDEVTRRFELQRSEHSRTEEGFLLWALIDEIVDRYFDVNDAVDERLEAVEEVVFSESGQGAIPQDMFAVRRDLMEFRRAAAPMREFVDAITRRDVPFVSDEAAVHFHDIYDRILRVLDLIESQRDLLTGLLEADLAVISNRLNEVMKKMTSWGAILIVATLIAGIYGMNFREMPELRFAYGYPMALGLMGVSTFVLYRMFKKRDWL